MIAVNEGAKIDCCPNSLGNGSDQSYVAPMVVPSAAKRVVDVLVESSTSWLPSQIRAEPAPSRFYLEPFFLDMSARRNKPG